MEFTWLSRWQPQFHAILRIITGLLFLEHGTQKFLSFPPGEAAGIGWAFAHPGAYAGVIELITGLLVAIGTLAVHSVESLLDRKRSVASLAALGMPRHELAMAQRWEARLVAMPMAVAGVLLGSGALAVLGGPVSPWAVLVLVANMVVTLGLVWLAILAAVRVTRRWAVQASLPANLRTE